MIPDKLPQLPKAMFRTPCSVVLTSVGLNADGEQATLAELSDLKCCFNDKHKQVMNAKKQIVQLEGQAIFIGDIAPDVTEACTGTLTIGNTDYKIYSVKRPRNPDNSVYNTILELM